GPKGWKSIREFELSGREDLNLGPFGPESGPESSAGGANRRQLCAILTDRGWGRVQPVAGFGRVSQGFFYPFSTQLRRDNRARWRTAGGGWAGRHAGAEEATAGQRGAHARRPAGPLGRARSAAQ